uniref:Mitochondrial thiamine pyrophosphate carrier n=1 Tax=Eptatretus burgeri TaxID=7764 RepID=A0A8C4R935_EPTBU
MVGYKPGLVNLSPVEVALAGCVSGFVSRVVVSPLDLIKIRFQLQVENITRHGAHGKYQGLVQAMQTVWAEEGLSAFWKGHVPAQLLSVSFGCVQFVAYEVLTELAYKQLQFDTRSPGLHFTCGGMAACAATLTCQPLDMLRTRLASQGEPRVYHGLRHAVSNIYHHDGMVGFYRGLAPTLVAVFPYAGMQFSLYTLFTRLYKTLQTSPHSNEVSDVMQGMLCGSLAGMISKTLTYPLDLIKKRLQVQSFQEARNHFGQVSWVCYYVLDCYRREMKARVDNAGKFKGLKNILLCTLMIAFPSC